MPDDEPVRLRDRRSTALETHIQSVLAIIIVGVLAWSGATLDGVVKTQIRLVEQVKGIKDEVASLKVNLADAADDRYRGRDAARDQQLMMSRLERIETKVESLINRVQRLEFLAGDQHSQDGKKR